MFLTTMATKVFFLLVLVTVTMIVATDHNNGNHGDVMDMLQKMQKKLNRLEAENVELRAKNAAFEKRMAGFEEKVASLADTLFLAIISEDILRVFGDEVIIWDSAPINPGDHFSTETGGYTTPVNGYYQFSVTKRSNGDRAQFWLLVDEQRYVFNDVEALDAFDPSGSVTINMELSAGQIVRVENNWSDIIYGTDNDGVIQSWFTGHMLYAL